MDGAEKSLKKVEVLEEMVKRIGLQQDQAQQTAQDSTSIAMFLERSLPAVVHLQICEGLRDVLLPEKHLEVGRFE